MPERTTLDRPDSYYGDISSRRNTKHDLHCMCQQCFQTPVCCTVCQFEFRHINGLVRHRTQFHEMRKGDAHAPIRQRLAKRALTPDGLGYLVKAFSAETRKGIDTNELSRFAQYLQDSLQIPQQKRKHIENTAILQELKKYSQGKEQVTLGIPKNFLLPVYQIWEASGVAPKTILLALLAYGLEYLAKELRQYPTFPEVKSPDKKLETPTQPKRKDPDEAPSPVQKPKPRFL